jgi:type II secretory pathway pseudopilin PulG
MNIRGIGEASFLKVKSLVTITPPRTDRASADEVAGYSLVELIFVVGVVAVMAAAAIPQSIAALDRSRTKAAARHLAAWVALARMEAVKRGVYVALCFGGSGLSTSLSMFADGNGNGVRTRDIQRRIDRRIDSRVRLFDQFPGVQYEDVRIGSSTLLSISPLGTATSGTLYLRGRDGTRMGVVSPAPPVERGCWSTTRDRARGVGV